METKKLTAAELMKRVTAGPPPIEAPREALDELRKLCSFNDSSTTNRRVGRRLAIEMLASYGVTVGREALDRLCAEQLRRKSYAKR
jgi:hypothetical protein